MSVGMPLDSSQLHRAAGVLLGMASGDALGAGYEFGPGLPDSETPQMAGGGSFDWEPGEWTDDTSMAIPIAELAAQGVDLRTHDALARISARWIEWARTAADVGIQTSAVLHTGEQIGGGTGPSAEQMWTTARELHESYGKSGGNGSLMRTAPVALAYLHDPEALAEAAVSISSLTHHDPETGQACVLWCAAIRHAVLAGEMDIRVGLGLLKPNAATTWAARIDEAERSRIRDFPKNGWVVHAFQAAWCAIATTPVPVDDPVAGVHRVQHFQRVLEAVVRAGGDTDTVAAIAGGLLGARYGASAVPATWRQILHGWPGYRADKLISLALLSAAPNR